MFLNSIQPAHKVLLILLVFLVVLFGVRKIAQGVPPAGTLCVILPTFCSPPVAPEPTISKQVIGPSTVGVGQTATFEIKYQATRGAAGARAFRCGPDSNPSNQDLIVNTGQTFYIGDPQHIPSSVSSSDRITTQGAAAGLKLPCRSIDVKSGGTLVVRTRALLVAETVTIAGSVDAKGINGSDFNGATWENFQKPLHSNGGSGGALNDDAGQARGGNTGSNGSAASTTNGLGVGILANSGSSSCLSNIDSDICTIFRNISAGNGGRGRSQVAGQGGQAVGGGGASEEFGVNAGAVFGGGGGYAVGIFAKNSITVSGSGRIDASGGTGGGNGSIYYTAGGGGGSIQLVSNNRSTNGNLFAKAGQSRCERGGCDPGNGFPATDGTINLRPPTVSENQMIDRLISRTDVLSGCGGGGWVKISDVLPTGFSFSAANPSPSSSCTGPQNVVWDWTKLDPSNTGTINSTITLSALVTQAACADGATSASNYATIVVAQSDGSVVSRISNPATVNLLCPGLGVSGNVSSAGGGIQSSSLLSIKAPNGVSPVVTANGTVTITREPGVLTLAPYALDVSTWQTQITALTQRLLKEVAQPVSVLPANLNGGIYRINSPVIISGVTGRGTIIVEGTGTVTIGDNSNIQAGIIVVGDNPVAIIGSNIDSLIIYAPNSTIDFGLSSRSLNIQGMFIANRFNNLNRQFGTLSYSNALASAPPPGFSQILAPLIREVLP